MNTLPLTITDPDSVTASSGGISTWRDWVGIVASVGCAIHCAAMPFVFAYLPALGLSFLADESFHKWMALVCFLIAIIAFIPGIRRHGNWTPISVGAVGLIIITFAAFGLSGECCPSCSAAMVPVSELSGSIAAESACADCCECHPDPAGAVQTVAFTQASDAGDQQASADTESKDLLTILAPWITPFGGVLLVTAHLLNRRFGHCCPCCEPDPSAEADA